MFQKQWRCERSAQEPKKKNMSEVGAVRPVSVGWGGAPQRESTQTSPKVSVVLQAACWLTLSTAGTGGHVHTRTATHTHRHPLLLRPFFEKMLNKQHPLRIADGAAIHEGAQIQSPKVMWTGAGEQNQPGDAHTHAHTMMSNHECRNGGRGVRRGKREMTGGGGVCERRTH